MATKDEYVRKMHSTLEQWNTEIDTLAVKAHLARADLRVEYDKQIADLRAKQSEAKSKLERLQSAGEGAWDDMKAGVEMAWHAIGEAVDSAKSRFK